MLIIRSLNYFYFNMLTKNNNEVSEPNDQLGQALFPRGHRLDPKGLDKLGDI